MRDVDYEITKRSGSCGYSRRPDPVLPVGAVSTHRRASLHRDGDRRALSDCEGPAQ